MYHGFRGRATKFREFRGFYADLNHPTSTSGHAARPDKIFLASAPL